jgi:hypothetical protein
LPREQQTKSGEAARRSLAMGTKQSGSSRERRLEHA